MLRVLVDRGSGNCTGMVGTGHTADCDGVERSGTMLGLSYAVKTGEWTIEELYRREYASIRRVLKQRGIPDVALCDEVHDFFVLLHRWMRRMRLRRINREMLRNRLRCYIRNRKKRRSTPLDAGIWNGLDRPSTSSSDTNAARQNVEHSVLERDLLARYLECMTPKSRLAVLFYYLAELTREELADGWGISANTVATQAFRGIRQARALSRPDAARRNGQGEQILVELTLACGTLHIAMPAAYSRQLAQVKGCARVLGPVAKTLLPLSAGRSAA